MRGDIIVATVGFDVVACKVLAGRQDLKMLRINVLVVGIATHQALREVLNVLAGQYRIFLHADGGGKSHVRVRDTDISCSLTNNVTNSLTNM